jgi:uncharacterized membrane protein YgcG
LIGWIVAAALSLASCAGALAQGVAWDINDYEVTIEVREDSSLRIVETIAADFTREAHRGIFREIPYSYTRDGSRYRLRLEVESVTDGAGEARPFTQWRDDGRLHIRIGDPDVYLNGVQVYRIAYTVRRGLLRFDTHDELYWNAIGTEWAAPIERASAVVTLPDAVDASSVRAVSFLGSYGSTAPGPGAADIGGNALRFEVERGLPMRSGLTIVVGLPPDAIPEPALSTRIGWFLADNGILAAPVVLFALLLLLWRARGRDAGTPGPIVVQYEPPDGLSPAEAGTLVDEHVHTHDITATIVDLAIRGYLTIDASEAPFKGAPEAEEVRLVRTEKDSAALPLYEQRILDELFRTGAEVTLDELRFEFYSEMPKIRTFVYDALARRGYTRGNLGTARGGWMALGFVGAGAVVAAAVILRKMGYFAPVPMVIAAALCAIQMPVFAYFMPRKTAKGRRAFEQIKGVEEYIRRAAIEEIEAGARRAQFERLLPYAMALGLSTRWAKAFDGVYDQAPAWFRAPAGGAWSTLWMVHSLDHARSAMGESMTAQPRSSGGGSSFGSGGSGFSGGFSGGGGGGGGGGAW